MYVCVMSIPSHTPGDCILGDKRKLNTAVVFCTPVAELGTCGRTWELWQNLGVVAVLGTCGRTRDSWQTRDLLQCGISHVQLKCQNMTSNWLN